MQKLSPENQRAVAAYLRSDRQWHRVHRIGYARLMLKFAHAREEPESVAFWRAVIKANE